jgi:hypothetical protein
MVHIVQESGLMIEFLGVCMIAKTHAIKTRGGEEEE